MSRLTDRTARRTASVRRKVKLAAGTSGRARLSVFRSSKHIYAQLIDDVKGTTMAAASSLEKTMREGAKTGANIAAAKAVGKLIAERAKEKGIKDVSRRWQTPRVKADSTFKETRTIPKSGNRFSDKMMRKE